MATAWFIGSVVADIIIHLDHLPQREEDLSVISQSMQLGGCAFNASDCFRHLQAPHQLLCPVGTGIYGEFVHSELRKRQIEMPLQSSEANGCCYCFVEKDGERTFLSHHGAEYRLQQSELEKFPIKQEDYLYISGLEIEEESGLEVIRFLQQKQPKHLFFAPGPRLKHISQAKWQMLFALHPILHLNEAEALALTEAKSYQEASQILYAHTQAAIIITMASQGSCFYDGSTLTYQPAYPVSEVVDTIGAGDNHAGMCLYGLIAGWTPKEILTKANHYAAAIIQCSGGQMTAEKFNTFAREENLAHDSY